MKIQSSPGSPDSNFNIPCDGKSSSIKNKNCMDNASSGLETGLSTIRTEASAANAGSNAYGMCNRYATSEGQQVPGAASGGNIMISYGPTTGGGSGNGLQPPGDNPTGVGVGDGSPALLQQLSSLLSQLLGMMNAAGASGGALPGATQQIPEDQQAFSNQAADGAQDLQSASKYTGGVGADGTIIATEQDTSKKPTSATGRPEGDTRSAEEIIDANPILKNLGDQKDINREGAYKQLGDWSDKNTDPKSRADAAYNAAKVLNYIDTSQSADGGDRKGATGKGDLFGITKDGDARRGTPAGNWKDFTEKGYAALKDDHRLDKGDSHVRADGTNKDNFQWFCGEVGKKLWFIPGLSNVMTGIGDSNGGFLGALKGAAGGVLDTWKGVAEGVENSVKHGRVNPASLLFGAYTGSLSKTESAPEEVKDIAGKL